MFKFIRDRRRKKFAAAELPEHWRTILSEDTSFFERLKSDERERFLDHVKVFVWEKRWIPAGGYEEIPEEIKVIIAACASRLVRNLPLDSYDRLTEVVVYPASFTGENLESAETLGLAHHWGTVVLAWDAVRRGIATPNDARDTAIHEFAHALDLEDGHFDGTPLLERGADYRDWARVLGEHFSTLSENPYTGVIDSYGAKNEAEFFAVATEAFFEQPRQLKRRAPDLYEQLARFYRLDPADRG